MKDGARERRNRKELHKEPDGDRGGRAPLFATIKRAPRHYHEARAERVGLPALQIAHHGEPGQCERHHGLTAREQSRESGPHGQGAAAGIADVPDNARQGCKRGKEQCKRGAVLEEIGVLVRIRRIEVLRRPQMLRRKGEDREVVLRRHQRALQRHDHGTREIQHQQPSRGVARRSRAGCGRRRNGF